MSADHGRSSCDDGGRVQVGQPDRPAAFYPYDEVYVLDPNGDPKHGPYTVDSYVDELYILRDSQGDLINGGQGYPEEQLELWDPFNV